MMPRAFHRLAAVSLVACSASVAPGDAPYAGPEPYPNKRPPLVLPSGEIGFITNSYSDSLDVVELATLKRVATYPIGRVPFDLDGPHHLAVHHASGALYVPLTYPVLSEATGPHSEHGSSQRVGYLQKFGTSDLRLLGAVRLDENPGDVAVSDDGRRVVVSHFDLSRAISKGLPVAERRATLITIDTTKNFADDGLLVPRLRVCRSIHGVALSPGSGSIAYVACYSDDAIARVDLDTKQVLVKPLGAAVNTGDVAVIGPFAMSMAPSAKQLAVGTTEGKDIRFVNPDTLEPIDAHAPIAMQGETFVPAWSADETRLFVPTQNQDGIQVIDVATAKIAAQRTFSKEECDHPHDARLSKRTNRLLVVCEGDHTNPGALVALDSATLEITGRITLGVYPDRLVIVERP